MGRHDRDVDVGRGSRHGPSHKSHRSRRSRSRSPRSKKRTNKKSKKRRRRDSSSSGSSGGATSDSSTELLLRLEKERLELKAKRKSEKDRLKSMETPEEKRARRLAKKESKAMRDKRKMGWDNDYVHYTNDDNPFGDSNLMQNFRWESKLKMEGLDKVDDKALNRLQRARQEEQRQELEKVKQRRLEREREREERDGLMELEERERENQKFSQWQKDEDDFHLKQARLRSRIRISDGRAKPIDLLAKYAEDEDDGLDTVEMHEPYTYLNGLTVGDLEDLLVDIKVYQEIDRNEANADFWSDIVVIVLDELNKLQKMERSEWEAAADRRQGINEAVADDVQDVFRGKTADQLEALGRQMEAKLGCDREGVDVGYWESLLSQLKAHLARARLRDKHSENLRRKLQMLKDGQSSSTRAEEPDARQSSSTRTEEARSDARQSSSTRTEEDVDHGLHSPAYVCEWDLDPGTLIVTEPDEASKRSSDQSKVLRGSKVESVMSSEERALEKEAKRGMNDDEAVFSVESALESTYEWSDKYRPRKPRYFNRVHTGFEWNKYNQTHYDIDNPPPKIVQGYKFNIFYPDLIDKATTPEYKMVACGQDKDFCVLKIHAGPPYEDIAFKIVNREWEFGYKRGFRCQFHNNIFQLWFHFKRLRYRR